MTRTPSPSEVDQHAATARADPTGPDVALLWQAVFRLDQWWLLPTGTADDPRPLMAVVGEQRFVLAFTAKERVEDFAAERSPSRETGGLAVLSITPGDMAGLAPGLAGQGVAGVLFDQGTHDLVAPVTALAAMWTEFGGSCG